MTSFDNLFNSTTELDTLDNANANANANAATLSNTKANTKILFTIDKTKNNKVYEYIYHLNSNKVFHLTKPLGEYTLKQHQLTSLYYMKG